MSIINIMEYVQWGKIYLFALLNGLFCWNFRGDSGQLIIILLYVCSPLHIWSYEISMPFIVCENMSLFIIIDCHGISNT